MRQPGFFGLDVTNSEQEARTFPFLRLFLVLNKLCLTISGIIFLLEFQLPTQYLLRSARFLLGFHVSRLGWGRFGCDCSKFSRSGPSFTFWKDHSPYFSWWCRSYGGSKSYSLFSRTWPLLLREIMRLSSMLWEVNMILLPPMAICLLLQNPSNFLWYDLFFSYS